MPNTRTFNIVIRSLCFRRKFSIAKSLASNQGFAANVVTYNTLIYFVFYYSRKLSEVKDLIFDMTAERIAPDEVTYTIIVDGLCRDGFLDTATSYFLESLEIGLSRDLFTVLTNRLAHNGKIWETIHVFKGMEEKGFIPDNSIFDLTIRIFCRAGYCHDTDMFKVNFILDTMLGKQ